MYTMTASFTQDHTQNIYEWILKEAHRLTSFRKSSSCLSRGRVFMICSWFAVNSGSNDLAYAPTKNSKDVVHSKTSALPSNETVTSSTCLAVIWTKSIFKSNSGIENIFFSRFLGAQSSLTVKTGKSVEYVEEESILLFMLLLLLLLCSGISTVLLCH